MKRMLFFTGQRMLAYHWAAGEFRAAHEFEADPSGLRDFERFLQSAPKQPLRLMVDVIEEGFRVDAMPRVFGADRRALAERLLTRHFRTTDYRQLSVQERQTSGRRDHRVLVSGLTNPELLSTWLEIIQSSGVALEGIYSLSLVGERMLPLLKATRQRALMLTQQSPGAVRQSFYDHGHLRLSRLVPIRYEGEEGFAGFVDREVHNTLRFLESQRLMRRSERINVYVITPREDTIELRKSLQGDEALQYQLIDYPALATRLGIRGALPTRYADGFFAQVLLKQSWPRNHYAPPRLRRSFFHRIARHALHASALAVLIVAGVVSGARMIEGRLYQSYALEARVETSQYERLYNELLREISAFPLKAAYVKDAVDLIRELDQLIDTTPERLMSAMSDVLTHHPAVSVDALRWVADHDPEALPGERALAGHAQAAGRFVTGPRYEIAVVKGRVSGFGRSYRQAVESFQRFVDELRGGGRFDLVEIQRMPFDIDPQAALSGDTGVSASDESAERATYELVLRIKARTLDGQT